MLPSKLAFLFIDWTSLAANWPFLFMVWSYVTKWAHVFFTGQSSPWLFWQKVLIILLRPFSNSSTLQIWQ